MSPGLFIQKAPVVQLVWTVTWNPCPLTKSRAKGKGGVWEELSQEAPEREQLRRSQPSSVWKHQRAGKAKILLRKKSWVNPSTQMSGWARHTVDNGHKNFSREVFSSCAQEQSTWAFRANPSICQATLWTHQGVGPVTYCSKMKRRGTGPHN